MSQFRFGKKRFYDERKFPRGFSRSGDFTLSEAELLSLYGDTMLGLEAGELEAEGQEEKHFLKVLANPGKAKTNLERVWLKYVRLARGRRAFHTLNSRAKVAILDSSNDDLELDTELEEAV